MQRAIRLSIWYNESDQTNIDQVGYSGDPGNRPYYLAVDEFAIRKGHRYATCVMDLARGDILWVGKGRTIKDFRQFFACFSSTDYPSCVKAVAMKEELCALFQISGEAEALQRWTKWFDAAIHSNISALAKFGRQKLKR